MGYVLSKADGAKTKTPLERQHRWNEWIEQQFIIPTGEEIPRNMFIREQTWANIKHGNTRHGITSIPEKLTKIRTNSKLQTLTQGNLNVEQRISQPYNADEITSVITNLINNKSMGTDGIPGEVYKILNTPITGFAKELMNNINAGQPMTDTWIVGVITHIHKKQHARVHKLPTHMPNAANI